jgi:hypothetical protein
LDESGSGREQRFYFGHNDDVTSIAAHPSAAAAASGQMGKEAKILVWSTIDSQTIAEIVG